MRRAAALQEGHALAPRTLLQHSRWLTHLLPCAQCAEEGCVSWAVTGTDGQRTLCGPHLIKAGGVPADQVCPYFSPSACIRHSRHSMASP
jgi:hypothetical protein